MLPPGASGEFESGANADPAPDAIQDGDWHEMLNGIVEPEGADHIINGVSCMRLRFFIFTQDYPQKEVTLCD